MVGRSHGAAPNEPRYIVNTTKPPESLHRWDITPAEARALQEELRERVRVEPIPLESIAAVAGADISYNRFSDVLYAACVVLNLPGLDLIDSAGIKARASFPYVPGLLSFRETPSVLQAWSNLKVRPDALIVDGHGYAHPRRFGIACHLGVLLDIPAIGCAKSVLVGDYEEPGEEAGEWSPLVHRGETIGAAIRTRTSVSPIFVSIGHRCDLETAVALVHRCLRRYRIPETTRRAHELVNRMRTGDAA